MDFSSYLNQEKNKPYMKDLKSQLLLDHCVLPRPKEWFKAFDLTPFDQTRVVIVGQDPYHGLGQANGLAFSVNPGIDLPPSLQNIFKELYRDLGIDNRSGDLTPWARQGVLLLNRVLTVHCHQAGSHQGWGWERFTLGYLQALCDARPNLVLCLWGRQAQALEKDLTLSSQVILKTSHPSPLSAYRGFLGSGIFSQINRQLDQKIDWRT